MNLRTLLLVAVAISFCSSAFAIQKKKICTWDPVGKNGPVMEFYSDLKPKAIAWGLDLELIAYTDEKVAANDFKAGVCEAAHLSAILSRQFVPFAGTLDAIGGIVSDEGLGKVIATIASPNAAKILTNGNYEAVAAWPVGAMFAFVSDRNIDTVAEFSGKKISVLNEDPQAHKLADLVGASPVGTSLATFSGQFNNGNIDILLMPALAYNTFELYHGLGDKGGILDYRMYYGMLQTIAKKSEFPEDFGENMRNYVVGRLKDINKLVADAEAEIPAKYWVKTTPETRAEFVKLSRDVRVALKAEDIMDPKALKLLWKIRCSENAAASECATPE
jgi:Solute-binding protein AdeT 1/2